MNSKHTKLWAAIFGCVLLGATDTKAVNITVPDFNPPDHSWNGGGGGSSQEDNETEPGTIKGQRWDLEAFVVQGTKLVMIGGFDFNAGFEGQAPGDLFIKAGGSTPGFLPNTTTTGTINNDYGYTHAVHLSGGVATGISAATVLGLNGSSQLWTVEHDTLNSNPWKYASGATGSSLTTINYRPGLDAATIAADYGITLLADGGSNWGATPYELHNALEIDVAFLAGLGSVYFSDTMQCGNDSLKGENLGGFTLVPDAGMSLTLLGLGLGGLMMAARKRA